MVTSYDKVHNKTTEPTTMKTTGILTLITWICLPAFLPSAADARLWKDATGKFSVEAEFISLDGDNVGLKTSAGKVITLSLAKLSKEDQALALQQAGPSAKAPASIPAGMTVTAKGKLNKMAMFEGGKQTTASQLEIVVTVSGGIAADSYAVGPVTAAPLKAGGQTLNLQPVIGFDGFETIDRSKKGFMATHPENGISIKLNFGQVPESMKSAGPVRGSVKVMAGGKEKVVAIAKPLTQPVGVIKDPALKAAGLEVTFTRKLQGDNVDIVVEMNAKSALSFVGLKLTGKNGGDVNGGSGSAISNGTVQISKSASKADMEGAALELRFREGGKEVQIPFDIPEVTIEP